MKIQYLKMKKPHFGENRFRNPVIRILSAMTLFLLVCSQIYAQNTKSVSGTITDETGFEVPGVNVSIKGTTTGVISDIDGKFSLSVPANATLVVSYIGYVTQEIPVGNNQTIDIILIEDALNLEEIVVVGYGTQKKGSLIGAVSAISSDALVATKNTNTQNLLTGKVPGVRVVQKTAEPGEYSNQFDIRGFGSPLIVVDGVPRSNFERMDPNEIENISVLKDASAAIYGVRAANGVVLITTKKGEKGKARIEYSMYYGIQNPAEMLVPVGAVDRMTLFNEKSMRSTTDPKLTYGQEMFDAYRNGTLKSTDWYKAAMRDNASQQQHNVSISGGGDKMDYYVNFGYLDQGGFLKSNDLNYNKYNLRSNLNAQLSNNLKASVRLNAILDEKERPRASTWEIYKTLWRSTPTEPVYANDREGYYDKPNGDIQNVVAMTNADVSGYNTQKKRIFQSTMDLTYNVPFIEGLSAKGLFSYDTQVDDNSEYTKEYNEYNYDEATNIYTAVARNAPTKLHRRYNTSYGTLWQVQLNYDKTFADTHNVNALILYEEAYNEKDNIYAQREFDIPLPYLFAGNSANQIGTSDSKGIGEYASKGIVGRLNYDFKSKYLAEFSFRYDGSSKFPKGKQWGFFPSALVGWRLSEETLIKENLSFVNNLKVRGSYGKMGDDGAAEYQFISGYDYPNVTGNTQDNYPIGYVFSGNFVNGLGFRSVANMNITWYTVKTLNIGLEADMWNGLLGFTFEVFRRNRDGLLAQRNISLTGSFGSTMPQENLNSDRTQGLELELRHRHKIGKVGYSIMGNISFTRTQNRYVESALYGNSYDYWRNSKAYRYNDIWFGRGDDGRFQSYDQIKNHPVFVDLGTLPGDYIYEDWNGDGIIDDMDDHPIATTTDADKSAFQDKRNYPLMNFALNLSADYKGFDLNLMFQGAGMSYVAYGEQLSAPLAWDGNALDMFMDRWRPADPTRDPYDPGNTWISGYYAYGAMAYKDNSRFAIQNGIYMRLKTTELGYTVPLLALHKVGIQRLRLFVNAYNLLTITGVKGVDPEKPAELNGYMYPLNRTFNFGTSITF